MTSHDERFMLSRDGAARREAALPGLRRAVRRRGAKRIAGQAGLSVLLVAVALGGFVRWGSLGPVRPSPGGAPASGGDLALRGGTVPGSVSGGAPAGAAQATGQTDGSRAPQPLASRVARMPASNGVLARVALVDSSPSRVRFVGDQELIDTFAASGRRVGVVHGQERTGIAVSDVPAPGDG